MCNPTYLLQIERSCTSGSVAIDLYNFKRENNKIQKIEKKHLCLTLICDVRSPPPTRVRMDMGFFIVNYNVQQFLNYEYTQDWAHVATSSYIFHYEWVQFEILYEDFSFIHVHPTSSPTPFMAFELDFGNHGVTELELGKLSNLRWPNNKYV